MPKTEVDPRTAGIEENGVTFPLLTLTQHEMAEQECRRRLLAAATEVADLCDLKGPDKFGSITSVVPSSIELPEFFAFLNTAHGQRYVFAMSLAAAGVPEERQATIMGRYVGYDAYNLAMALCGHRARLPAIEVAAEIDRRARIDAGIARSEAAPANPPTGGATNSTGTPPAST